MKAHSFHPNKMPRDVVTRWNSTYELLDFVLKHRAAVKTVTEDKGNGLRRCELDERKEDEPLEKDEWLLVEQLRNVLKVSAFLRLNLRGVHHASSSLSSHCLALVLLSCSRLAVLLTTLAWSAIQIFLDATQHFSRDDASIADVIPAMDLLDETLSNDSLNTNYTLPIRAAVNLGKKIINKYYNKTDDTEAYRIAMGKCSSLSNLTWTTKHITLVLHPSHKLEYFKLARWPAEWIQTAEDITREEYRQTYATQAMTTSQPSTAELRPGLAAHSAPVKVCFQALTSLCARYAYIHSEHVFESRSSHHAVRSQLDRRRNRRLPRAAS